MTDYLRDYGYINTFERSAAERQAYELQQDEESHTLPGHQLAMIDVVAESKDIGHTANALAAILKNQRLGIPDDRTVEQMARDLAVTLLQFDGWVSIMDRQQPSEVS